MPKLVIQIAKLEAPSVDAAGRKFGAKAYDSAGTKYTVPKAMFGMLQNGGWYEIFYEDKSFQGNPYKEIQSANATTPLATPPAAATNGSTPVVRARTAKEDEAQINERHRLSWIGERLDAVSAQLPLEFEKVFNVAEMFAAIYDGLRFKEEGGTPAAKAPAYKTGLASHGDDMSDEIPFITRESVF